MFSLKFGKEMKEDCLMVWKKETWEKKVTAGLLN